MLYAVEVQRRLDIATAVFSQDGVFDHVLDAVADGTETSDIAESLGVQHSAMMRWIRNDPAREKRFNVALTDSGTYMRSRILGELKAMLDMDIADIYGDDGKLRPLSEIPKRVRKALSGMTTRELFDKDGVSGYEKSIRLYDKLKAIELLGKTMAMFADRQEVTHKVTLLDLVRESMKLEEAQPLALPESKT